MGKSKDRLAGHDEYEQLAQVARERQERMDRQERQRHESLMLDKALGYVLYNGLVSPLPSGDDGRSAALSASEEAEADSILSGAEDRAWNAAIDAVLALQGQYRLSSGDSVRVEDLKTVLAGLRRAA